MLFDIGWPELLLIGVVALVVIGPKDLPRALRIAGYWVRKARTLSREFQSSVEQMIREAELDEMRQELKKATELDLNKEFQNTVDPDGSLAESIRPPDIPDHFDTTTAGTELPAPEPAAAVAAPAEPSPVWPNAPADAAEPAPAPAADEPAARAPAAEPPKP
ncbi:MAG TPA: Sec-independent protein translocase protein TatB [Stellaceae bacterium]